MNSEVSRREVEKSEMSRFERNQYFHGKLMTARDMETEQRYHRDRLHAISKHVLGAGRICGLTATVEQDEHLSATIDPGLGLDRRGRPVIVNESEPVAVKNAETGETTLPEGRDIYLFLEYDECLVESVPVPDSRNACEERCCYNRVVEQFEVTYTEEPPDRYKLVPAIDFPSKDDLKKYNGGDNDDNPALTEMARSYYEHNAVECKPNLVECESDRDCSLFLGPFEKRRKDDTWHRDDSPDRRPFIYTNDMLYAIIARHITDFDNPHEVEALKSIENVSNPGGNVDLCSPKETIDIRADENLPRVNLDVANDLVEEVDDLRDCVEDLKKKLDKACDQLEEYEKQESPEQESQRQEDEDDPNDEASD